MLRVKEIKRRSALLTLFIVLTLSISFFSFTLFFLLAFYLLALALCHAHTRRSTGPLVEAGRKINGTV